MADRIAIPSSARVVAVVGVAKNSGKTTTLRRLLADADESGRTVGLISTGVDGESTGAVTGADKPSIVSPTGELVVTAAEAAEASTARFDYLSELDVETPLGPALLLRVRREGEVLLAGLRRRSHLREAIDHLQEAGAERVFVDGAFGRTLAADGRTTDAVVLATGAVAGETPEEVAETTAAVAGPLRLEGVADADRRRLVEEAIERERAVRLTGEGDREWNRAPSAVSELDFPGRATTDCIAIPGLVSDGVVDALGAFDGESPRLLVPAAASLQLSADGWQSLRERWQIRALYPVDLVGITVNPEHPDGDRFSTERLQKAVADALDVPDVVDVVDDRDSKIGCTRTSGRPH